ncbi:MAG: TolC family protein [Planctomycetota bacterium]
MNDPRPPARRRLRRHRLLPLGVLGALLAACTPEQHVGAPPPALFVGDLPLQPALADDGEALASDRPELPGASPADTGAGTGEALIPVGLDDALRAVAATHPRIRAALEDVMQARGDSVTAKLLPNPSLGASYSLAPFPGARFDAASRQGGPPQIDLGLGFALDALLFGKRSAAIAAAELEVDAELARYAAAANDVLVAASDAYCAVLRARDVHAFDQQAVASAQALVDALAAGNAAGTVARPEVDRGRTAAALAQRDAAAARAALLAARAHFRAFLTGVDGGERAEPWPSDDDRATAVVPALAELLAGAEVRRPDVEAARRELAQARQALGREVANAWPWLRGNVGVARQRQRTAIGVPDADSWGAGLEFALPLFDRNQGNILRAQSAVRQAQLRLDAVRADAAAAVAAAHAEHDAACAADALLAEVARGPAEAARTAIEAEFAAGNRTLLEVLDARAACRDVARSAAAASAERLRTHRRLAAACGGLAAGPAPDDAVAPAASPATPAPAAPPPAASSTSTPTSAPASPERQP